MTPLKYYQTQEVNRKITERTKIFTPRGMCKFKAILKYKFGDLEVSKEFETDHRIPVKKFAKWVQIELNKTENEFYSKVEAMRLEALLSGDEQRYEELMELPTEGIFTSYVVS